jgi:hypothetical protein
MPACLAVLHELEERFARDRLYEAARMDWPPAPVQEARSGPTCHAVFSTLTGSSGALVK